MTDDELKAIEARASASNEQNNYDFCRAAHTDIPALIADLRAAREVLRFYADERNWEVQDLSNGLSVSGDANDGGERARKALGEE